MHIGYFVSGWPLSARASGIVTYIDIMKHELESMGHKVSLFCGEVEATSRNANVHMVENEWSDSLWGRLSNRFLPNQDRAIYAYGRSIANAAAKAHALKPIDVFEIEESFGWSRDLQALDLFPVTVRLHGPTFLVQAPLIGTSAVDHKIEREGAALKQVHYVTAPAQCTLNETMERYALKPQLARAIPNPYRMPSIGALETGASAEPSELLFVGRFDLVKGADMLLEAFAILAKAHPRLRLIFAGPDAGIPQSDGEVIKFRPYVERHLNPDVRERIEFLGQQTPDQIRALRARGAITLVTSRWENQPYVALEAMAQRCPVVAFASGGVAEVVQHERNGLCADPGDVEGFARQVERFLLSPPLRNEMANAGFDYVSSVHNPTRVANDLLQTYETARMQ